MARLTMRETSRQIQRLFSQGTVAGLSDAALLRRFANARDEDAFAALVARHGPMVLGVCRGVLADPYDAEDAFQATFLALSRQAQAIRIEDSLGRWLHRLARRIAVKANARGLRRRAREPCRMEPREIPATIGGSRDESAPALLEEIDRLPEALRRPLVLCALEGLTQVEAAQVLSCGEATVRRRLACAKERLRNRLDRRGVALLSSLGTVPAVPQSWSAGATKVALADATGLAVPSGVAGLAAALATGRLVRRLALVALVGVGLAAGVTGILVGRPESLANPPVNPKAVPIALVAQAPPLKPPAPPAPKSEDEYTFSGRVLDPEGRPFQGAAVYARPRHTPYATKATVSDAEGRFRLTFDVQEHMRSTYLTDHRVDGKPLPDFENWAEEWPKMIALAPGSGLGVAAAGPDNERLIRLVNDVPVEGRVLDLQGQPIAGARVRVRGLLAPKDGDLTPWLDAARAAGDDHEFERASYKFLSLFGRHRDGLSAAYPALLPAVKTDRDGRFRIVGIGRERVAWVAIEKPGIESKLVAVATRPGLASFVVPYAMAPQRKFISNPAADLAVHGARFDHVAGPARAVEGTVSEAANGVPIAGALVVPHLLSLVEWPNENRYQAVTDTRGHYRVDGLPEGIARDFAIEIPKDQPFVGISREVAVGRGPAPEVRADFRLKRGVWVEGRVLVDSTGERLSHARVLYRVFPDNPHLPRPPDEVAFENNGVGTDQEGRYRLPVYPGRGLLTVNAGFGGFASGVGADRIPGRVLQSGRMVYPTLPEAVAPTYVNLVAEINPAEGAGPITLDLALQKGRSREGRAVGPDGPVPGGLLVGGLDSRKSGPQEVEGDSLVVKNLSKGEQRRVVVRFDEKKLIGLAVVKAEEEGPFEVRLEPWATLSGRLVDDGGKPRSKGLTIDLRDDLLLPVYAKGCQSYSNWPSSFLIDAGGRFLAEALLPGQPYEVQIVQGRSYIIDSAAEGLVLKPGEAKDLGDVVVKTP